mgnify:CR=1 FL=1
MSEFIKTLFEEKEKLDEICHIEEQQRKKIQKHLDTLTDDQVRDCLLYTSDAADD